MKRKIPLILLLIITKTTSFSSHEITLIEYSIQNKQSNDMDDPEIETFMQCLNHPYFKDRFTNFKKILGIGTFGVVIEADFQLFKDRPQTLPVAVKVNYETRHEDPFEMVRNYVSLMVNQEDVKFESGERDDLKVFNLSKHFEKMRIDDDSIKKDVFFVDMLYEGAVINITVYPEDNISNPPKHLSTIIAQLGFLSLEKNFLENPKGSDEIQNRNSKNVSKLIVQTSFGLSRIHANGFFQGILG
jgi:hypothetical protein